MDLNPLHRFLSAGFRRRRMERLAALLKLTPNTTVLDVGGIPAIWEFSPVRPKVTFVTIDPRYADVVADGCHLPFGDKSFDVAFANSVIEHVQDQEAFASEIRRVAGRIGSSVRIGTLG